MSGQFNQIESRGIRWKRNEKCRNHTKYNKMALEIFKKIPKKSPRYPENCQILTFRRKVNHIIIARQQQLPQMDSSFILNSRCAWLRFWLAVWISFKIATSDAGKFSIIRRSFVLANGFKKNSNVFKFDASKVCIKYFCVNLFFVPNMHPMNVQKNKRFLPILRLHFTVKGAFTHSIKMFILNLLSSDSPLNA